MILRGPMGQLPRCRIATIRVTPHTSRCERRVTRVLAMSLHDDRSMNSCSPLVSPIGFVLALAAAPVIGCMPAMEAAPGGQDVEIDEAAILAQVASYRDSARFEQVSGSYASALNNSSFIEVYASRTSVVPYGAIDPGVTGSGAVIPEGGVLVREVLDTSGVAQRLTVMAKGPAGYNPDIGDWYWAVTDLHGVPIVEGGIPRSGRVPDCYGCHLPRPTDDFLFGVPAIDRGGTGTPPPQGGTDPVCGDFACEGIETKETCPKDCNHGHA
jgi:hypothetical protein